MLLYFILRLVLLPVVNVQKWINLKLSCLNSPDFKNYWEEQGFGSSATVTCTTSSFGFQTLPVNNNPLLFTSPALSLCTNTCVCVCVSYLEEGAVALQPGGAERGDGAQAAPEVDA